MTLSNFLLKRNGPQPEVRNTRTCWAYEMPKQYVETVHEGQLPNSFVDLADKNLHLLIRRSTMGEVRVNEESYFLHFYSTVQLTEWIKQVSLISVYKRVFCLSQNNFSLHNLYFTHQERDLKKPVDPVSDKILSS